MKPRFHNEVQTLVTSEIWRIYFNKLLVLIIIYLKCQQRREQKAIERFFLFSFPLFVAFLSYIFMPLFPKIRNVFAFLTTSSAAIFGLMFLPWFMHDVLEFLPSWMKFLIVVPSVVLWFAFPVMRKNATLAVIVYFYSLVVLWRVYKENFQPLPYNDHLFSMLLWLSGLVLYISPLIGTIQQRLGHIYNRYVTLGFISATERINIDDPTGYSTTILMGLLVVR